MTSLNHHQAMQVLDLDAELLLHVLSFVVELRILLMFCNSSKVTSALRTSIKSWPSGKLSAKGLMEFRKALLAERLCAIDLRGNQCVRLS